MQPALQPQGIPPTPETVRKRRYDVIANLLARGGITQAQAEAAGEIRMVLEAVGRGMFPSSGWKPRIGKEKQGRTWRDFIARMDSEERHAWEFHYLPWTREMAIRDIVGRSGTMVLQVGRPGTTAFQLVIDVVIDNATLGEVEDRYRLVPSRGVACRVLRMGLECYVQRMGSKPLDTAAG